MSVSLDLLSTERRTPYFEESGQILRPLQWLLGNASPGATEERLEELAQGGWPPLRAGSLGGVTRPHRRAAPGRTRAREEREGTGRWELHTLGI